MESGDILKKLPKEGFLKVEKDAKIHLSDGEKAALNRKGNEFFNKGEYEKARRVFLTTGYSDGLIRMGDYYLKKKDHLEALRMYRTAPAEDRVATVIEYIAKAISFWIKDEKDIKK
jgi:tetratricopeptide (TPR) repeat protein